MTRYVMIPNVLMQSFEREAREERRKRGLTDFWQSLKGKLINNDTVLTVDMFFPPSTYT